jgi:hypothetical protein
MVGWMRLIGDCSDERPIMALVHVRPGTILSDIRWQSRSNMTNMLLHQYQNLELFLFCDYHFFPQMPTFSLENNENHF